MNTRVVNIAGMTDKIPRQRVVNIAGMILKKPILKGGQHRRNQVVTMVGIGGQDEQDYTLLGNSKRLVVFYSRIF